MIRLIGPALIILLVVGCGGGSSSTDGVATMPDNPPTPSQELSSDTVVTQCGTYQGRVEGGVVAFKGLSYAKPPVQTLRWQPPQAPDCATATVQADTFAPACAQFDQAGGIVSLVEDCLYLNVWTPTEQFPSSDTKPVLFFIHGGGNQTGSTGGERLGVTLYDGARLAERSDTVVVTVGYRLGALGFLAHPALSAENAEQRSGNYGILDQIAALEWVQENIAVFGGDPERVTLFGESAGARNVCSLAASPLASGLFGGAIMQSGGCRQPMLGSAERDGQVIASAAGCESTDDANCLRSASVQMLLEAVGPEIFDGAFVGENIGPVVDDYVLLGSPEDVITNGAHNMVPMIIGSNADETGNRVPPGLDESEYIALVHAQFGTNLGNVILARYPVVDYVNATAAYAALSGDVQFVCSARRIARAASAHSQPVYSYRFAKSFESTTLQRFGAFHGIELFYLFQHVSVLEDYVASDADESVEAAMASYWGAFASNGNPASGTDSEWEPYSAGADKVLWIDAVTEQVVEPRADQCEFWAALRGG